MQVTSLEQLKNIRMNDIEELPPFADGTPFIAELRKPNMIMLMSSGNVPNSLMKIAMEVFQKNNTSKVINKSLEDPKELQELVKLLLFLAEQCLVKPSFKQLQELEIELNENQLSAILTYSQGGVKALENFREQQKYSESSQSSNEVQ